ncbi:MAG TPA: glycosyltransferase [Chloroflexi bacterium]|nr:glycosyltransferase [Chloroflexota bacterium]
MARQTDIMNKPVLHQFAEGAAPGDAITGQMLSIRQWLRDAGYTSEIYAASIHPAMTHEVGDALRYRPQFGEMQAIYHHSIGSDVVDHLRQLSMRLLLIYHNVTPPEFFQHSNPGLAAQLQRGIEQLPSLREQTGLALGDSSYNTAALIGAGFTHTGTLPLPLDETDYQHADDPEALAKLNSSNPWLLFVGRLAPNKRQDDLVKLLYYVRRILPEAQLALVGALWSPPYVRWLRDLVYDLQLENAVIFTGHVSQQTMVTYYRHSTLYVSMSEHEGFGKPLVESMYFNLPVLAYASTGVPDTLDGAGVLFHEKHFEALAELVDLLVTDQKLRTRVLARQRERLSAFLAPTVRSQWQHYLNQFINRS